MDKCQAPAMGRDASCDHDSNELERALYIVADNVAKHTMSGKFWDCIDECWLEALAEAKQILIEWKQNGEPEEMHKMH